jgi:hypothetical protein
MSCLRRSCRMSTARRASTPTPMWCAPPCTGVTTMLLWWSLVGRCHSCLGGGSVPGRVTWCTCVAHSRKLDSVWWTVRGSAGYGQPQWAKGLSKPDEQLRTVSVDFDFARAMFCADCDERSDGLSRVVEANGSQHWRRPRRTPWQSFTASFNTFSGGRRPTPRAHSGTALRSCGPGPGKRFLLTPHPLGFADTNPS